MKVCKVDKTCAFILNKFKIDNIKSLFKIYNFFIISFKNNNKK